MGKERFLNDIVLLPLLPEQDQYQRSSLLSVPDVAADSPHEQSDEQTSLPIAIEATLVEEERREDEIIYDAIPILVQPSWWKRHPKKCGALILLTGSLIISVGVAMLMQYLPATNDPKPTKCFVDKGELLGAINKYMTMEVCPGNRDCEVGREYGWPMNTWCVSNIKDMSELFYNRGGFNEDISDWNVSLVTNMYGMFHYATAFNGDLSSWDVSSVTDMSWMFIAATAFNGDLSSWDVSSVTDLSWMFYSATAFNGDLSSWDVSFVTDMSWMFSGATAFNGDLSRWDVSSIFGMTDMFSYATAFNGDLSSWDISSVDNMNGMFYNATSFNHDLCAWADIFPYSSASDIFLHSGCTFDGTPQSTDLRGPFCASSSC